MMYSYLLYLDHSHHCHVLKLKRVVAIIPNIEQDTAGHPHDIEMKTFNPVNHYKSFYLHIIVKKGNHKWQHRKVLFEYPSVEVGSQWFTKIQNTLKGITSVVNYISKAKKISSMHEVWKLHKQAIFQGLGVLEK